MTIYNKLDHMIRESKEMAHMATLRENESLMYDVVLSLEKMRSSITAEQGNSEYIKESQI
jgi:hypothetical protein